MLKQVDYAMVTVSAMARSVRFYEDVIGLSLKFDSNEWSEFSTSATTLALHGGGKPVSAQMPPREELVTGTCSIGFSVDNLDQAFQELKAKGANFVMPDTA